MMIEEFGTYKFTFLQGFFYFLIKSKIARGGVRDFVRKLFRAISASDSAFDITYESVRMRVVPWTNNTEAKIISHYKIRDKQEIDYIASVLPTDGVFVDIGANIGYYSLMIANKCPSAKIIAYEPNSVAFERMTTNIELNNFNNIIAIATAIGNESGVFDLNLDADNLGSASIKDFGDSIETKKKKVKLETLKDSLEKLGITKIDALKIDVEGFEDKALMPYFKSVDKNYYPDTIVIEHLHPEHWDENIIDFLLGIGYYVAEQTNMNLILSKK